MPRGTELSDGERGRLIEMHKAGIEFGRIAASVNRHHNTDTHFLHSFFILSQHLDTKYYNFVYLPVVCNA